MMSQRKTRKFYIKDKLGRKLFLGAVAYNISQLNGTCGVGVLDHVETSCRVRNLKKLYSKFNYWLYRQFGSVRSDNEGRAVLLASDNMVGETGRFCRAMKWESSRKAFNHRSYNHIQLYFLIKRPVVEPNQL